MRWFDDHRLATAAAGGMAWAGETSRFAPCGGITRFRFKGFLLAKVSADPVSAPDVRRSVMAKGRRVNAGLGDDALVARRPFTSREKKFRGARITLQAPRRIHR